MRSVNLKVEIRRNEDGVVVTETMPNMTWFDDSDFMWRDGNFSCDCNRGDFFLQAQGIEPPQDSECSTGKYSVRITDADTGEVLYDELTEEA